MLKTFSSRLFGGSCFLCRGRARDILCGRCDADLPRLAQSLCPRCALASPEGATCGRCLSRAPHFDATVAALAYAFPADALVHALKFRGELALAPFLGALLLERLPALREVDYVLAVPLSRRGLRERGYNQAVEIARPIAAALRAPLELTLCERERDTAAQTGLPWSERERNVRGAFAVKRALAGASIAVVDDVMTTGATLDEMAATLKRAGAGRVVNWVLARTAPPD
jgi:ComF family protein